MSKKTTTKNEVAFAAPPETADTQRMRTLSTQGADYSTPIRNAYARAEQNLSRSYQNPLGGATTADVREKSLREQKSTMMQSMGLDLSNAAQQNAQSQFGNAATVAGMTQPRMYNSGGTQTTSDPMAIMSAIAGVGGSALG